MSNYFKSCETERREQVYKIFTNKVSILNLFCARFLKRANHHAAYYGIRVEAFQVQRERLDPGWFLISQLLVIN
jgi:hypothetical protein